MRPMRHFLFFSKSRAAHGLFKLNPRRQPVVYVPHSHRICTSAALLRYGSAREPPNALAAEDENATEPSDNPPATSDESIATQTELKALPPPNATNTEPILVLNDLQEPNEDAEKPASSMERVLDVNPPNLAPENKLRHIQPPKYIHRFDTWTSVKQLQDSGFSQAQSITAMKAIRQLLAENIQLAQDVLVSQSNVENEAYLFQAACAELQTEIFNNRKQEADMWRTQRDQVQHEVDIISQTLNQDILNLKDILRGLSDDRKMAVKMEQKQMESKIQELNYKITIKLNSEARGSVESVRWLLTRRAATAIAISTIMVLATLNYSRYMTATQEAERKKYARDVETSEGTLPLIAQTSYDGRGRSEDAVLAQDGVSGG